MRQLPLQTLQQMQHISLGGVDATAQSIVQGHSKYSQTLLVMIWWSRTCICDIRRPQTNMGCIRFNFVPRTLATVIRVRCTVSQISCNDIADSWWISSLCKCTFSSQYHVLRPSGSLPRSPHIMRYVDGWDHDPKKAVAKESYDGY